MKRTNALALALLLAPALASAGPLDDAVKRDLPGWSIYKEAEGDLDGDQAGDAAAILKKGDDDAKEALLVVYLADGKKGLRLVTKAPKAICVGCGGPKAIMGEPLGELEITARGILTLSFEGGSREVWDQVCKWRWAPAEKQFKLIGETYSTADSVGEEPDTTDDINYSTMRIESTVGKKKAKKCTIPTRFAPPVLSAFDFDAHASSEVLRFCR